MTPRLAKPRTLFDPPPRRIKRYVPQRPNLFMLVDVARVGDRATLPDVSKKRPWIVARCASTSTVMLGCLPCRQPIATIQQLLFHLEAAPDQTHVLARQCGEHGWEAL